MSYLDFAVQLARKSGDIMKNNFTVGMKKEWKEEDGTPLTVTDTTVNQFVIDSIRREYPSHSVIAEEGSFLMPNSEYTWICDPVDGTLAFSHGLPTFVFSLALLQNNIPIIGVVLDPILNRLFTAEQGKGAYLNETRIHCSSQATLQSSVIGFPDWKTAPYQIPSLHDVLREEGVFIVNVTSTIYPGVLVAAGEFAATIHPNDKPWDIAALQVIIGEAGGKVTDLFGNVPIYNGSADMKMKGMLASNGLVHSRLLEIIQRKVYKQ